MPRWASWRWREGVAGWMVLAFLVWLARTGTLYRPDMWEMWWAVRQMPIALLLGTPGLLAGFLPENWTGALWPLYLAPLGHALGPWAWLAVIAAVPLFWWKRREVDLWVHGAGFLLGIYLALHLKHMAEVLL